jgi:tRNA(adenine34) deaminase
MVLPVNRGNEMQDEFFMGRALEQAGIALAAGEFPVGCVIADQEQVIAAGFRKNSSGDHPNELDHAEITTLRKFMKTRGSGKQTGFTIYVTMEPCLMCFGAILLAGIQRIVYAYEDVMGGGTRCRLEDLPALYAGARVEVVSHVSRDESLALFKTFFSNPLNTYWEDSLLARYTRSRP